MLITQATCGDNVLIGQQDFDTRDFEVNTAAGPRALQIVVLCVASECIVAAEGTRH